MTEIDIPWHFRPRPYQEEFLNAQQRFKIAVMHRRS